MVQTLVATIHFSQFTCCFRSFGVLIHGFFLASRKPKSHNYSLILYSLHLQVNAITRMYIHYSWRWVLASAPPFACLLVTPNADAMVHSNHKSRAHSLLTFFRSQRMVHESFQLHSRIHSDHANAIRPDMLTYIIRKLFLRSRCACNWKMISQTIDVCFWRVHRHNLMKVPELLKGVPARRPCVTDALYDWEINSRMHRCVCVIVLGPKVVTPKVQTFVLLLVWFGGEIPVLNFWASFVLKTCHPKRTLVSTRPPPLSPILAYPCAPYCYIHTIGWSGQCPTPWCLQSFLWEWPLSCCIKPSDAQRPATARSYPHGRDCKSKSDLPHSLSEWKGNSIPPRHSFASLSQWTCLACTTHMRFWSFSICFLCVIQLEENPNPVMILVFFSIVSARMAPEGLYSRWLRNLVSQVQVCIHCVILMQNILCNSLQRILASEFDI